SDSLLDVISPYFKFPEWTLSSRRSPVGSRQLSVGGKQSTVGSKQFSKKSDGSPPLEGPGDVKDLNTATAEELKSVNGIGDKLSARIVKFRDRLGGFLVDSQLYDVYGLGPE